jgi:hypothetical protein
MLIGASALFAQDDAIARHFDHLLRDPAFRSTYISPKMFEMTLERDEQMDAELRATIKNLRGLRTIRREGNVDATLMRGVIDKLRASGYEELMQLREKGEDIHYYTRGSGRNIDELVLVMQGREHFAMLSLVGNLDLKVVARLSKSLNVQGADKLDRVDKK